MSKSNYVSLYGTLIKDAVIKTNDKGNEYALFTLSVPQDGTKWCDYINCIAFGDMANDICKHGDKDTGFCIVGNLRTSSYEKDGKKQYSTNVVVESFELLND